LLVGADIPRMMPRMALSGVDRLKGKFRSFLLASFQNYLSAEEYATRGKESVFATLKVFVGIGESRPQDSYEEAAETLGVGTVKTLIHRLRKQYLAAVREQVARTDGGAIVHCMLHI
jgi:hypothetical protein